MIASSRSFQGDHVQTRVKFPEVEETAKQSFGSFFLRKAVHSYILKPALLFGGEDGEGRELIGDAFGRPVLA